MPVLLNSITDLRPEHAGRVVVTGSHGGLFAGAMACRGRLSGAIFSDAGMGLERAGVAGVMAAAEDGLAAAAVDASTSRIGEAADILARGRISAANALAEGVGITIGMSAAEAVKLLFAAGPCRGEVDPPKEARRVIERNGIEIILADSASLIRPEDAGAVIVTGSHGGLIGGDPARALKAPAKLAIFNDAGFGPADVGAARLPALEARGIAAATVSAKTARIGDAASALDTGVISAVNAPAAAMGLQVGDKLADGLKSFM